MTQQYHKHNISSAVISFINDRFDSSRDVKNNKAKHKETSEIYLISYMLTPHRKFVLLSRTILKATWHDNPAAG